MKKNKLVIFSASLFLTATAVLHFSIRNGLLYSSDYFNSDALFFPRLFKGIFENGQRLNTWIFPHSGYFFPDMPLAFFAMFLAGGDIPVGIANYAVMYYAIAAVLAIFIVKSYSLHSNAVSAVLLSFSSLIIFTLSSFASGDLRLIAVSGFHGGMILSLFFLLNMIISMKKNKNHMNLIVFVLILIPSVMSDAMLIAYFIVPFFFSSVLCAYIYRRMEMLLPILFTVVAAFSYRKMIRYLIDRGIFLGGDYKILPGGLIQSFTDRISPDPEKITEIFIKAGILPSLLLIVFFLYLLWIFYFSYKHASRQNGLRNMPLVNFLRSVQEERVFMIGFLFVFFVSGFVASLITSGGMNGYLAVLRYYNPLFLVSFIFLPVLLEHNYRGRGIILSVLIIIFFIVVSGREFRASSSSNFSEKKLALCMDRITEQYQIEKGIAGYWKAGPVNALSKHTRADQVMPDLVPMFWLDHYLRYLEKGSYSFVITDGLERTLIEKNFGKPDAVENCPDAEIYIYAGSGKKSLNEFYSLTKLFIWFSEKIYH